MTLFASLFSGASGLTAQSRALGMISDNIANVNTIGYKAARPDFAALVTQQTSRFAYSPGGVRAVTGYEITRQGLVQGTESPLDAAISGSGFFVVNTAADSTGEQLYTRAGSFTTDRYGNIVTPSGFYLQGWALDVDGDIVDPNQLTTVNIRTLNGVAIATTRVEFSANLDARQDALAPYDPATDGTMQDYAASGGTSGVQPHFSRRIRVFDSLGQSHTLTLAFLKTADNTWRVELYADAGDTTGNPLIAADTLQFDGDGALTATPPAFQTPLTIAWANGASPSEITVDFRNLTQFAADSDVAYVQQNGAEVGQLNGVSIDEDGYVVASFTSGVRRRIYRLPMATFANPSGLEPRTGNVFAETERSGAFNLRFAGTGGAGTVTPGAVELANVDLADEFTKMIVTQRAYTANARVISTVNDMLDELMRIKT